MESAKRFFKGILLFLLSVTWCVIQTLAGAVAALLLCPKSRFQKYRGMIIVYHPYAFTVSLGTFALVSNGVENPRTIRGRMYGHYAQSLIYGPFFVLAVLLPQLLVRIPCVKRYRAERGIAPHDLFVNRQAARLQARMGE